MKGWSISFPVQACGCQFSPNGDLLSYYSVEQSQIALYYGYDQFTTNGGSQLIEQGRIYRHSTDIVDMGVTWNYMVIAEKANNFRVRNTRSH